MDCVRIGILGAGAISGIYLDNITKVFRNIEVEGICDLNKEKALEAAKKYGIPKVYGKYEELLDDPDVEVVLNLSRPSEHYHVIKQALEAGKNVYTEKPLSVTFEEGSELTYIAKERKLYLAGSPDTFLGAGIQTCRKLIEDGFIGKVVGAAVRMTCHGHESWHPSPEFYYKKGGGPMMDMGPYYLTALVNLLGGVRKVSGMCSKGMGDRVITSQPKYGEKIKVEVPTTVNGMMEFENGVTGTIMMSFDIYSDEQFAFEIYGTEGTLRVPDPNCFGGAVSLFRPEMNRFCEVPLLFPYSENFRGLGVAEMASAMRKNEQCRANADQLLHVLEIMEAFEKSSISENCVKINTSYRRGKPMEKGEIEGVI